MFGLGLGRMGAAAGGVYGRVDAAPNPYRAVTMHSAVPNALATTSGAQLGRAGKDHHVIGSGDVSELRIVLNHWAIGSSSTNGAQLPIGSVTILEMWVTKVGNASGVRVTWSAADTKVLSSGDYDIASDALTPEMFGFSGSIPRGTQFYIGYRAEVATVGDQFCTWGPDSNKSSNSSVSYAPGSATITNLQGSSALGLSGTWAGINETGLPLVLIGKFVGGDKPVFCGIGDSITYGSSDTPNTSGATNLRGWFQRALVEDTTTYANPKAGLNMGRPSGITSVYVEAAPNDARLRLLSMMKYANHYIERYGINDINTQGNQGIADTIEAGKKIIWDLCRTVQPQGGLSPVVIALPLTPKVTGTYTTLAGQTSTSTIGGTIALLDADVAAVAGTSTGPDLYLENAAGVRGSTDNTNVDYWKWNISPQCTTDGLHPNAAGYDLMAVAVRSWMASRF